jgi:hypothetical protein
MFLQSGTGAVARTVQAKLRDTVSVKDFGAVGDGVADDTAAFTSALAYIAATGNPVFLPQGIYLTDPFQIAPQTYALQGFFYGDEAENTIIRRRGTGAGAFVTIGATSGTIFQASLDVKGITIDGGVITNGPACVMYDVVRSLFDGVKFMGGSRALQMFGGISVTFDHCWFQDSVQGLRVEKFTSLAGGGWPNIIRLSDCHWNENTEWGVWFDNGRMLIIDGGQVEGNGTTLAAAQGGIYVGANVGEEVNASDPESIGLVCYSTWFEANRGVADVHLLSGINTINDSNFFSTSTQTTNDVKIEGGRYRLRNLNMSFSKTANVLETSGVTLGNTLDFVQAASLSFNSSKTALNNGWFSQIGNGAVPGVNAFTAPLIQVGSDMTGVNPTITFNQAFKIGTTPRVYLQSVDAGTGLTNGPQITAVTNAEFTILKSRSTAGVQSTANYQVDWIAIGENP